MIISFDERQRHMIITTIRTNVEQWRRHLMEHPMLELGDSSRLIEKLSRDVDTHIKKLHLLRRQYQLHRTSLRTIDQYGTVVDRLQRLHTFLIGVKESQRGSRDNTRRCLQHLEQCRLILSELEQLPVLDYQGENALEVDRY